MFNKFTERARKVILLAKQEAKRFNHDYIGTEHILLGLLREGEGVAARVLLALQLVGPGLEQLDQFGLAGERLQVFLRRQRGPARRRKAQSE